MIVWGSAPQETPKQRREVNWAVLVLMLIIMMTWRAFF